MAEGSFRGKSLKAIVNDAAEGLVSINPLFLKKFDKDMIKDLYEGLNKAMTGVRNEKVVLSDSVGLRMRNLRLQRLHNALIIVKNTARENASLSDVHGMAERPPSVSHRSGLLKIPPGRTHMLNSVLIAWRKPVPRVCRGRVMPMALSRLIFPPVDVII